MKIFLPLITQSLFSCAARVWSAKASEPEFASVKQNAPSSFVARRAKKRDFRLWSAHLAQFPRLVFVQIGLICNQDPREDSRRLLLDNVLFDGTCVSSRSLVNHIILRKDVQAIVGNLKIKEDVEDFTE